MILERIAFRQIIGKPDFAGLIILLALLRYRESRFINILRFQAARRPSPANGICFIRSVSSRRDIFLRAARLRRRRL